MILNKTRYSYWNSKQGVVIWLDCFQINRVIGYSKNKECVYYIDFNNFSSDSETLSSNLLQIKKFLNKNIKIYFGKKIKIINLA